MTEEGQRKKMQQVITRAGADEGFRQRLLADATTVLKEEGIEVPEGVEARAVENTESLFHIVLPSKSSDGQLTDDELAHVAGGKIGPKYD